MLVSHVVLYSSALDDSSLQSLILRDFDHLRAWLETKSTVTSQALALLHAAWPLHLHPSDEHFRVVALPLRMLIVDHCALPASASQGILAWMPQVDEEHKVMEVALTLEVSKHSPNGLWSS